MSNGSNQSNWGDKLPNINTFLAPATNANYGPNPPHPPLLYRDTTYPSGDRGLEQYRTSTRAAEFRPQPHTVYSGNPSFVHPRQDFTRGSYPDHASLRPWSSSYSAASPMRGGRDQAPPSTIASQHGTTPTPVHHYNSRSPQPRGDSRQMLTSPPPLHMATSASSEPSHRTLAHHSSSGAQEQASSHVQGGQSRDDFPQPVLHSESPGMPPRWGMTKAGKVRKRLAQACESCRKKKTKCEPRAKRMKCLPCQKTGSSCSFETEAPSPSSDGELDQSSPNVAAAALPPLSHENSSNVSGREGRSTHVSMSSSKSSMDISTLLSPSPAQHTISKERLPDERPAKRQRRESIPSTTGETVTPVSVPRDNAVSVLAVPQDPVTSVAQSLGVDPYQESKDTVEHYLHHYFANINMTSYCMFPRQKFMHWIRTDADKTQPEKMLVHAMLALGSLFSSKPAEIRNSDGKRHAQIARRAMSVFVGKLSLPMVQTRLVLALLDHALGNGHRAWDYGGGAFRAACGMKLNVESKLRDVADATRFDFLFDKPTLVECRRRTFWSAYVMDRFIGFCSGHLCMLQNEDCLLRLPCDEAAYDQEGEMPPTPFFDNGIVDSKSSREADRSGIGLMAYLVEVQGIWGDVLSRAYRSKFQAPEEHAGPAELFYEKTLSRLDRWKDSLKTHLHPSQENIDQAFEGGYIGVFVLLWLLYHCAAMKLCRHTRHQYMSSAQVERTIVNARYHASKVLDIMSHLAKSSRDERMPENTFIVSTPFTGCGVLAAVDILTAAGSLAELPEQLKLLNSGIEVIEELSLYWASARRQSKLIAERVQNLMIDTTQEKAAFGKHAFFAETPIETTFGLEHDLIYDTPVVQKMQAICTQEVSADLRELIKVKPRTVTITDAPRDDGG